jgi:hypothetical protein
MSFLTHILWHNLSVMMTLHLVMVTNMYFLNVDPRHFFHGMFICALNAKFQRFYPDLIKFPYFADLTQRGDKG